MQGRRVSQRDLRGSAGAAQRDKERKTPKGGEQKKPNDHNQYEQNYTFVRRNEIDTY